MKLEPDLHDRFLEHAILVYDAPWRPDTARFEQAREWLDTHPELVDISLFAACAAGDAERVERWLNEQADQIDQPGGPRHWPPLLYATYARLPGRSTLEVGEMLLQHGADPNACFIANDQYRFTALTGVFGQGEAGPSRQPEHPDMIEFARLLLDAGADPNDSQATYNRMFEPDNRCLELLLEYGLAPHHRQNWWLLDKGQPIENPDYTLHFQLAWAVKQGMRDRTHLLLEHGLDVNATDQGRPLIEWALLNGHDDVAHLLQEHGARARELSPVDQLCHACLTADSPGAKAIVAKHPGLLESLTREHPDVLHKAAEHGRLAAARLLIELGVNVNEQQHGLPLHSAAYAGNLEMVQLLVELGADTSRRDLRHFQPAIGYALYNEHASVVEFLDHCPMDIHTAAARGNLDRIDEHLSRDPLLLEQRFIEVRPPTSTSCDRDWMTPLAYAVANDRIDSVRHLLVRGANTNITRDDGSSLLEYARQHASPALVRSLESH